MGPSELYVSAVHRLRQSAERRGVLERLEASSRPSLRHLRTLFAIYDAEDLSYLDLPWWSYAAIRRIEEFLRGRPEAKVFEFGAGASTTWLARRAGTVISVEHDTEFATTVSRLVAGHGNVTLLKVPADPVTGEAPRTPSQRRGHEGLDFTRYVATIDDLDRHFDLIVIDGRARLRCLDQAKKHLAPGGLIVFDDVQRSRYRAALRYPNLDATVYRGFGPCLPLPTSTAVLEQRQLS